MSSASTKLGRLLQTEPVFALGSDLDWNPDAAVRSFCSLLHDRDAKATLFATHRVEIPRGDNFQIAIHPNFLPGSTHGSTVDEVIDHCFSLYPEAETFRSHSYFDNQVITEKMAERGIRYDANLCLYRQEGLVPLQHCHIEWRFPSWLDDNVHWHHGGSWRQKDFREELERPGLKIINFHPLTVALNLPDRESYEGLRSRVPGMDEADIVALRVNSAGPRTFLEELLDWLRGRHPLFQLGELYRMNKEAAGPGLGPPAVAADTVDVAGRPAVDADYEVLSEAERMAKVRAQYNAMAADGRYATSRDYNNREIELDVIARAIIGNRVLDLGCGNGYTLLSLGTKGDFERLVGVDFSENMISGAQKLLQREFNTTLRTKPQFVCSDVFDFIEGVEPGEFDTVITERLVINLPSTTAQKKLINGIIDRLPAGGRLLMIEGTAKGFAVLNRIRALCGLPVIPDRYPGNESSNKIEPRDLQALAEHRKDVILRELPLFSFYSLASKVLHPLIVHPAEPKFTSVINDQARRVQAALNELGLEIGTFGAATAWQFDKTSHVVGE